MAITKEINIVVNTKGADNSKKQIDALDDSVSNLSQTQQGLTKHVGESTGAVLENGGAMGLLNAVTGGTAQTVKDAVEAMALFAKGSKIATAITGIQTFVTNGATIATKALRTALIATGFGAVVVLISALVVALGNMKDSAEEAEHAQKLLNDEIERSNNLMASELSNIEYVTKAQILRAKAAGKSEEEIRKIEKEGSEERLSALKEEQTRLLKLQEQKGKTPEQAAEINKLLLKNTENFNKEIQNQELARLGLEAENYEKSKALTDKQREDNKKAIEEAKKEREALRKEKEAFDKAEAEKLRVATENARINAIQEEDMLQQTINDLKLSSYDKQKQDISDHYFELIEKATLHNLDTTELEKAKNDELKAIDDKRIEDEKKAADEKLKIEQDLAAQKRQIRDADFANANNLVELIKGLSAKNKAIQKAAVIAQGVLGISSIITNTQVANAAALAPPPIGLGPVAGNALVVRNIIGAGIGIASTTLATAKALAALGGGGSVGGSASAGGGGSQPSAPSFNLVRGTGSNQIAESLANTSKPIKAYVTTGDVTTGQSLDRNVIRDSKW